MNRLDRLIAYFSPQKALTREMQRNALNVYKRSYDGGRADEPNSSWQPAALSSENAIRPNRSRLIARARDLERNDPVAGSIIDGIAVNVVGTGYTLRSMVMDVNNKRMTKITDRLEDLFKEWGEEPLHCDYGGEMTFAEILLLAEMEKLITGEAFIRLVRYSHAADGIPLMLQVLESELLDMSIYKHGNNPVFGGIEFDVKTGRRAAYHFYVGGVDGWQGTKSTRISAEDICHVYAKGRASQLRGVTKLSRIMPLLKDLDGFIESTAVKARVEACFCAFITKQGSGYNEGDGTSRSRMEMAPGVVQHLQEGEDIKFATPTAPGGGFGDFLSQIKMLMGASVGASYELISRDVSKVNYSSARINMLEDRKHFKLDQALLISRMCRPIFKAFVDGVVLSGNLKEVSYEMYLKDKKRYQAQKWIPSGWSWVDPQKEVAANREALDAGLTTRTAILAAQGHDLWEVMEERRQEDELMKEMGMSYGQTGGKKSEQEVISEE